MLASQHLPPPHHPARRRFAARLAAAGFLFFFVKGLVWLAVAAGATVAAVG